MKLYHQDKWKIAARQLRQARRLDTQFRSPLFSDFSPEELLAIIQGLSLLSLEPGEILMTEGESGGSLFLLTTGSVRAYVKNREDGTLRCG